MNRIAAFLPERSAVRPLIALAVLGCSVWIFASWGYSSADEGAGEAARQLADALRTAEQPIRLALRAGSAGDATAREPNGRSVLAGLDAAASRAGVQVTRLTPRPTEPGVVNVELLAGYGPLSRFVAESEALGGVVRGLQVRAPDSADAQNRQVATFAIEMTGHPLRVAGTADAGDLPDATLAMLSPFQMKQAAVAEHDLSTRYRLTGMTRIGTELMATIDGRDYVLGDEIDGMRVSQISEEDVHLSGPGCACSIRFRSRDGKALPR